MKSADQNSQNELPVDTKVKDMSFIMQNIHQSFLM